MERYIQTDRQSDMAFFSAHAIISFALRARNQMRYIVVIVYSDKQWE
jgi:hypothetical protein